MGDMMKLGPKEMKGETWDQGGMSEIVQICISHQNNCINSFKISVDRNEDMPSVYAQNTYENPDGMNFSTVVIDHPKEFLVSVSGEYLDGKLASIVFVTNKRRQGPFGKTGGSSSSNLPYEPFNFEFVPRNLFGGFHGSAVLCMLLEVMLHLMIFAP
ncbi:jacalin-like lectin domain-containing protein [Artemisia annua]|uniref:Jacalin-like lectin domain-containing protein n=1 Tax=Artemisia annua TaxID=35608 RepID=A0A2U1ME25_ARTAN|nr:jacalin-like lectin domain-containing protein [Artemisia annua]